MEKSGAIGIDFGSKSTIVAAVKAGGIEIVLNESSGRATPTMVAFGDSERLIGDPALAQQRSNHKNTVTNVLRFVGLNADCEEQLAVEKAYTSVKINEREDKKITFSVVNKGEKLELVPEQVLGAFIDKLKGFWTGHEDRPDVVIGVPPYFSAVERQAVLDGCRIGNVNCLKLMNENTAVALNYGFFRRKEFDDKPRNVAFLDFGHSYASVTIASFTQKKVRIISQNFDRNLGARNFDDLLVDKLGGEFNDKYGCDPRKAPKARLRLADAIEKARKILSANQETNVACEALLEDEDMYRALNREEFEEMIMPNVEKLRAIMEQTLKESGLKPSEIHSIEMIGEGTRIPIL